MSAPTPRHISASGQDDQETLPPPVEAAQDSAATHAAQDPDVTLAPAVGEPSPAGTQTVSGYEILGELGRGGMGVVYKARQVGLNRVVALKMILAGGHAGQADLARFRTEAEAIARLRHPNIVQVYEIGTHDGKPFFSLEFCAGGSLDHKLNGTPLEPRQAARLAKTLAEAMQAAHDAHVIHRDLKPANVLLASSGPKSGELTPKITDFGLAKKLDESSQTHTGAIMGTPSYMAPEQAEGRKEVGPQADVYALGAILYDCLTGRPPFRAATSFDTILQVVSDEPVPPRQLNAKVPRDLETVVLKCLAKEPSRRYASAKELADDIGRFEDGKPIKARPVGVIGRAAKWVGRNPWVAGLLTTVFALLLLLLGGTTIATFRLDALRRKAQEGRTLAEVAERRRAEQLWESLLDRARAGRATRQTGQRFDGLRALREAAGIRASPELRDEMIACLGLFDFRPAPPGTRARPATWPNSARYQRQATDPVTSWVAQATGKRVVVRDGAEVRGRLDHGSDVSCLLWRRDGRLLAVAADNLIHVYRVPSWEPQAILEGHEGVIQNLEFSHGGDLLLSLGSEGDTILWDVIAGRLLVRSRDQAIPGQFSQDDSLLGREGQLWEVALAPECKRLHHSATGRTGAGARPRVPFHDVTFSPDGSLLLTAGGITVIWDGRTGRERARLPAITGERAVFLPDGSVVGTSGTEVRHVPRPLETDAGHTIYNLGSAAAAQVAASSPNGRWVLIPDPGRAVGVLVSLAGDGSVIRLNHPHCRFAAFSPDSRLVATSAWAWGPAQPIRVWEVSSGRLVHEITEDSFACPSFTPDGKWLVAGAPRAFRFWEVGTWKPGLSIVRNSFLPVRASFSRDGKLMAGTGTPTQVRLFELTIGTPLARLISPEPLPTCAVALSPDGTRLAVATGGDIGFLWDIEAIRSQLRELALDWE